MEVFTMNIIKLYIRRWRMLHMCKYLLLSHGSFCKTALETVKLIIGDTSDFEYILFSEDGDLNIFKDRVKTLLDKKNKIIIFTDLYGGSPLITLADIIGKDIDKYKEKVSIITGMNLNMLLEAANQAPDDYSTNKIINAGKMSIVDFMESMKVGDSKR